MKLSEATLFCNKRQRQQIINIIDDSIQKSLNASFGENKEHLEAISKIIDVAQEIGCKSRFDNPNAFKMLRERYNVSIETFSLICGFSIERSNQLEEGESPTLQEHNTLYLLSKPDTFFESLLLYKKDIEPEDFKKANDAGFIFKSKLNEKINKICWI